MNHCELSVWGSARRWRLHQYLRAEARGRQRWDGRLSPPFCFCRHVSCAPLGFCISYYLARCLAPFTLQLSAMDVSARTTMKGAAKCDKHCELQNSVNQQKPERILCFRDTPESMPASVSTSITASGSVASPRPAACASLCVKGIKYAADAFNR